MQNEILTRDSERRNTTKCTINNYMQTEMTNLKWGINSLNHLNQKIVSQKRLYKSRLKFIWISKNIKRQIYNMNNYRKNNINTVR